MSKLKYKFGVKKHLLNVKTYQPGRPIDEVKRELGLKNVVKLASNENPYAPSPRVLAAIKDAAKSINRYPDSGCFYLRKELSARLNVKEDQLIFGNGSDEIIVAALRAFASKGDEVVIAKPSFMIYEIASKVVGAKIRSIPLEDFSYDLDGMLKVISKRTKLVFIGNPDNPSGTYVSEKQLKSFLKKVPKNVLVFIDEAYYEYVLGRDYPDSIMLLKSHKNIIIARTFSKMYGLAGLRVGYGIASPEVIDILNRVREPFNVNSIAQAAALACLKDKKYYKRIAKDIEKQRQFLYKQLSLLKVEYRKTSTNFILVDVGQNSSKVSAKLLKMGVIVRDMNFWGLNTFIRVSIGAEKENKKFVKALKSVLARK